MKYDTSSGKLSVSVREAVATARRGISGYTPLDSEEPEFSTSPLPDFYKKDNKHLLSRDFDIENYTFCVYGELSFAKEDEIHFISTIPTVKDSKKGEVVKQTRGEAFMLGAMYLFSEKENFDSLNIKILYIASDTREVKETEETVTRDKLFAFFDKCMRELCDSGKAEIERVTKRLPSMKMVKFPYGKTRDGQDEFIRTAYKAIARGSRLYATAPTGTGKTVSALFPAIRALGNKKCEKVFYLTPKQTTATAAKECIEKLSENGAKIRSVILIAKEKLCKNSLVCRESKRLCKNLSSGHMKDAVMALFDADIPTVSPSEISKFAEEFGVCPYELSLTYSELCDVIICDFNYLFDPQVYIRRFFSHGGNYAFLIDEAHNLSERAREMYSAEISLADIQNTEPLGTFSELKRLASDVSEAFKLILLPLLHDEVRRDKDGIPHGAYHTRSLPGEFYTLFSKLSEVAENELFASFSAKDEEKDARISYLREYLFKVNKFYNAVLRFDDGFELFAFLDGDELRAKIFCLDTGGVISSRLDLGKSAVLFSGTLSPLSYYRSVLGGDRSSMTLTLDSPFSPEQLSVSVMDKITTRFSEREDSLLAVCRVIAATLSARRGNYMIFSPSFAYAEALANAFSKKYPKIKMILQKPNMTRKEKDDFLLEFSKSNGTYLAAFCVMGGIYSEGIDLSGDKLIGAIIVGIGMPSLSFEREAIAAYYQEKLESGTEYAYIYPGMNRVLQAAGRVIRTEDDRGVIVLIDDRFDDPIYKKTAPSLWSGMEFLPDAKILKERLEEFWHGVDEEE